MNLKPGETTRAQITDKHLRTSDTATLKSKKITGAKSEASHILEKQFAQTP